LSVFGKSLFQPGYKILRKGFEEQLPKETIMRVFENRDEIQREQISPSVLIEELAKNQRSKELIMNQLMMSLTHRRSPPSIKIS